jgi:hypothetical protein
LERVAKDRRAGLAYKIWLVFVPKSRFPAQAAGVSSILATGRSPRIGELI